MDLFMSVLSEWNIIKQLGEGIVIYPFKNKNASLRGCCICLTASEFAYIFTTKNNENKQEKLTERLKVDTKQDSNSKYFTIPGRKTALVWTSEFVFLSRAFCGSLHSKVKLASKGIGHIGTRVNPNWGGIMAIALHNLSDNDIDVEVGEVIAYLRVYRLTSKSDSPIHLDDPGKLKDAIPPGFSHPPELVDWLEERHKEWRASDEKKFRKKFKNLQEYKDAKREHSQRFSLFTFPQWEPMVWFAASQAVGTIVAAIAAIGAWMVAANPPSLNPTKQTKTTLPNTQIVQPPKASPVTK